MSCRPPTRPGPLRQAPPQVDGAPRGMPQATRALWSPKIGRDRRGAKRPEIILMKRVLLLAPSALVLTAFVPEQADAQGRRFGVRAGVGRGPVIVGRGRVYGYPRGYYGYRHGYYGPGVGAAVGLGLLGGAALGAAAAAPYYGYGGDPCLRQQQVIDAWGNAQWTYVRVC